MMGAVVVGGEELRVREEADRRAAKSEKKARKREEKKRRKKEKKEDGGAGASRGGRGLPPPIASLNLPFNPNGGGGVTAASFPDACTSLTPPLILSFFLLPWQPPPGAIRMTQAAEATAVRLNGGGRGGVRQVMAPFC